MTTTRTYITKENLNTLKHGDILKCDKNGIIKEGLDVYTITYEISDLEVQITKENKKQYYFKSLTKNNKPDMRTKSIDIINNYFKFFKS